jgi:cell division transport system ATP-binding protein
VLHFNQATKRFPPGYSALKGVSFHLEPGSMTFLTGHSGAGKTTLLKLITAIERPSSGRIYFNGREITRLPRRKVPALRRQIGTVFQDHKLLYDRSVRENVALALRVRQFPRHRIAGRVNAVLHQVGLDSHRDKYPITLSGGEQQRVAIARALVNKPQLLLADEPTGNLDQALGDEIMDLFRWFQQFGTTVLVATHDLRQPERLQMPQLRLHEGALA